MTTQQKTSLAFATCVALLISISITVNGSDAPNSLTSSATVKNSLRHSANDRSEAMALINSINDYSANTEFKNKKPSPPGLAIYYCIPLIVLLVLACAILYASRMKASDGKTRISWSIGAKLMVGFGVVIFIVSGTILYSILVNIEIGDELDFISKDYTPIINMIGEIEILQLEQSFLLERAFRYGESDDTAAVKKVQSAKSRFDELAEKTDKLVQELEEHLYKIPLHTEKEAKEVEDVFLAVREINMEHRRFEKIASQTLNCINDKKLGVARLLEEEAGKTEEKLNHKLEDLLIRLNDKCAQAMAVANEHEHSLIKNLLVILFVITALAVAIALYTSKKAIINPINELVALVENIALGDLSDRRKMEQRDEIGMLSDSVNYMADKLEEKATLAEVIAQGDLTREASLASDKDTLGHALEKMLMDLNNVVVEVKSASQQVKSGSSEISDTSQALSQGATEQAASLEEISSSVSQISSQVKSNAEQATQASDLSRQAGTEARNGSENIKRMVESMAEIDQASKRIEKIIKTIDDIAFQTNILALNAAVEAARAGIHGKGFAVVAEEVRSLAARSAEAATETFDLITTTLEKIDNGQNVVKLSAESFSLLEKEIVKVNDIIGEIAAASNEQAEGVSQISIALTQIDQVTQQNTAAAEEAASASEELSSQATLMDQLLAHFKVKDIQTPHVDQSEIARLPDLSGDNWGSTKMITG